MSGINMDVHEAFTRWAIDQGIMIKGVKPHYFPQRGMGLMASTDLETGDVILQVPIKALRKASDIPSRFSKALPQCPVHGLFALSLNSCTSAPWQAVLPTKEDIRVSMPLLWDPEIQQLLPHTAKALLEKQKTKTSSAWDAIRKAFPEPHITQDEFIHNYLIVNSRTFYYLSPALKSSQRQPRKDDRLALNPFADYLNHSSNPTCAADLSATGYTIRASQSIKTGSEIFISYGSHNNDFLLGEYGFILDDNACDSVSLDPWITPLLTPEHAENLKEVGFLDNYVLDANGICYRTQVVLRILCLPLGRWRRFVNGSEDEEAAREAADEVLRGVLSAARRETMEMINRVGATDAGLTEQRKTLLRRWNQIAVLLGNELSRIEG
ncbi:SET domain-containing protein [Rutstroemia sp. NJR-2017a WRK4]|nr:SET domain-containing protein [Rutstroemia sp. NJR-2017a WRK4]